MDLSGTHGKVRNLLYIRKEFRKLKSAEERVVGRKLEFSVFKKIEDGAKDQAHRDGIPAAWAGV